MRLIHLGIPVRDADRSVRFYSEYSVLPPP
jgi:catechol 2,3-dioxygenase-like lactoylglutathione lyase family enzyme